DRAFLELYSSRKTPRSQADHKGRKAYTFSLFLHLSLLFLFLFITKKSLQERKPIEIELSLSYIVQERPQEAKQTIREEKPKEKRTLEVPKNISIPREEKKITPPTEEKTTEAKAQEALSIPKGESSQKNQEEEFLPPHASSPGKAFTAPLEDIKGSSASSDNTEGIIDPKQVQNLYLREKLSLISSIVQKHISYPPLARRMGWEGKVVVCFTLTAEGKLKDLHIEKSSGYEFLDKNALDTIKRIADLFPKPTVEVMVRLPVSYKLE
ncbi:MAG: energy transducer TonB, partial [Aquificaceae bacterium]